VAERKSATNLTDDERESLLAAVLNMKATIANPGDSPRQQISSFDQFVAIHIGCLNVTVPSGSTVNMGHLGPPFLPWHREFLLRFEKALVANGSTIGLPYWDWTDHKGTSDKLFVDEFLGARDGQIARGYFAFNAPGTPGNSLPAPAWWPAGLSGWQIKKSLSHIFGTTLRRRLDVRSLTVPEDIRRLMRTSVYHDSGTVTEVDPIDGSLYKNPRGFWNRLEAGRRLHNFGHGWVGGHMGHPYTSPNDPIFFFHHCNIDRLWAEWQENGHAGTPFYPGPGSGEDEGHKLNDSMWPWVGTGAPYTPNELPKDAPIPDFTGENQRTPADVIDISVLDYAYL
jgi:hypothetical protein